MRYVLALFVAIVFCSFSYADCTTGKTVSARKFQPVKNLVQKIKNLRHK